MRHRVIRAASVAVLALSAETASAIFMAYPEAPVTRLLANVTRALAKSPDDPHLLYLAGRTHAIAYAQGEGATGHATGRTEDEALPVFSERKADRLAFEGEIDGVRIGHLREGIRLLRRAADLARPPAPNARDERPLLHLGLAWLLDDGSRFAPRLGHPAAPPPAETLTDAERAAIDANVAALGAPTPEVRARAYAALRADLDRSWSRLVARADAADERARESVAALLVRWWQDQALDAYRRTFLLAKERDAAGVELRDTLTVSREAGTAILRLLDGVPRTAATDAERAEVAAHLRTLGKRPVAITPVLFPVSAPARLADLLPAGRAARFDLLGDGDSRAWPWPSADAGFLVWTPAPDAPVTSGRRLFGSRTWWIFWRDGYEPLSLLDDDDDGRLAGAELQGIGVWRDADGDGVSDPGEVVPATAFGLAWIAVRATRTEDGVPAADAGVGLADGSTRPTYDWTPRSLPDAVPQP